ncbi:unnamed protein product [Rotaria magnacalcarata]|uniref:Ionotropic glutamate receptor C-terminal domain-containing protein n=2 Tax=Rotaria magnacalcarata TaxID=392030 RepID=A0A815ZLW1_9BILA|nr:unnamed protein product [Rotaria magnacalcarata]CAF4433069.1 unnamed protein product [Rotaria magnacalcarata]
MSNQLNTQRVRAAWPPSNISRIQLLGLFQNDFNLSDSRSESAQLLALFKTAIILSQRYNITVDEHPLGWHMAQTCGNVIDSLKKTCLVVSSSNIVGIVGPRLSREAHMIAAFAETIGIPVVSYTATDPDLSSRSAYPSFYRTIPSDTSAALSIVHLFMKFNWTSCVIIYQNDAYGYSGMRVISESFTRNNFKVREMIKFDIATRTIQGDLKNYLLNSGTRIIVLWAVPMFTLNILQYALDQDVLGPRFLWILSSSPSLDSFSKESSRKLVGMLTIEPITGNVFNTSINASLLHVAYEIWQQYEPESFPGSNNVDQYALFAFDATWLLIQSLERLCTTNNRKTSRSCISLVNSSSCFDRYLINATSFFDQINSMAFVGVTGPIEYRVNGTDRSKGIYYFAQNAQVLSAGVGFIPVLKYSEENLWETYKEPLTIVWPNNSCVLPSDRATLSGITLNIGIFMSAPFAIREYLLDELESNKTKFIGYVPDLIEHLREKMNFIPNITSIPVNISYSESILALEKGDYDILVGDITVTAKRREIVSFSASIFDNSLSVIIRKPLSADVDLFSYMRPFADELWIAILAATIYASILIYLLERGENAALRNRSIVSAGAMTIWYSIGTIMGYGVDFHATTASGRLLTIALYMLSLVLVATYTANLASNLTKARPRHIINGIDDLKKGKISPHRVGIIKETAMEQYYVREISRGSRNFYPATARQHILNSLLDGTIDATILDSGVADYITHHVYCNLTVVGETFDETVFGIAMSKNWLYGQELDMNILALRELGHLDMLRKKWFQTSKCGNQNETLSSMRIESMAGLFLIFGIITAVALLPFIWSKRSTIKNYFYMLTTRRYAEPQRNNLPTKYSNPSS